MIYLKFFRGLEKNIKNKGTCKKVDEFQFQVRRTTSMFFFFWFCSFFGLSVSWLKLVQVVGDLSDAFKSNDATLGPGDPVELREELMTKMLNKQTRKKKKNKKKKKTNKQTNKQTNLNKQTNNNTINNYKNTLQQRTTLKKKRMQHLCFVTCTRNSARWTSSCRTTDSGLMQH